MLLSAHYIICKKKKRQIVWCTRTRTT